MDFCDKVLDTEAAFYDLFDHPVVEWMCDIAMVMAMALFFVSGMSACSPLPEENNYYDIDIDVAVESPAADDDDSVGEEEPPVDDDDSAVPADDDDSAGEEDEEAALNIHFLTYVNDGPFTVFPGDTGVTLGRYIWTATGRVDIRRVFVPVLFSDSPEELYVAYDLNPMQFAEHISACMFVNTADGSVVMGPVAPDGEFATLVFEDDLTLEDEQMVVDFRCDFTEVEPDGVYDGFYHSFVDFVWASNTNGEDVYPSIGGSNGTPWAPVLNAILTETPEESEEPILYLSLHAASPMGTAIPWNDMLALKVNASATGGDVVIDTMVFDIISTDNVSSQWNRCGAEGWGVAAIGQGGLHMYSDAVAAEDFGSWTFWTSIGPCSTVPAETVVAAASVEAMNVTVPQNTVVTFDITVDAQYASAFWDDALQLSLGGISGWSPAGTLAFAGIPVTGGILTF